MGSRGATLIMTVVINGDNNKISYINDDSNGEPNDDNYDNNKND